MTYKELISRTAVALVTAGVLWSAGWVHAAEEASDPLPKGAGMPLVELAQEEDPAGEAPGVWDLPMGSFAVALVIAAAIGAVGGFVYAGIMGPRRRDEGDRDQEE